MRRRAQSWGFAAALALLAPSRAGADDSLSAQALFEDGRRLKEAGKCAEALPKFEASQRIEPAVGTLLNLADCYDALGRKASAWVRLSEAASIARRLGDDRRAEYAERRSGELAPALSRLVIEVAQPVDGLLIERGGVAVDEAAWGTAVPVDPGEVTVAASAPGFVPWSTTLTVREPGLFEVQVPKLSVARATERGLHPQRVAGWSAIGLSGGALVAGIALAIRARVLDDASLDYCPDAPDLCLPEGARLRDEARQIERGAIVVLAAGAATAALGLALVFTVDDDEVALVPAVGPERATLTVTAAW